MGSEGAERDKKQQKEYMAILVQQGDHEDVYFKEQDQKFIKGLRDIEKTTFPATGCNQFP